uniref:Putative histone chaperone asf1 n=1 Tax=Anopheles triannulatus TaxID=58253 RepID=A0A2M4AYP3_9DIPT
MAKVHITNVVVLDNPSSFLNPFQFQLTFECIEKLEEDLEWKMIYVGSAESEAFDQVLDTIYVGPVPEGRHIFVFQAEPPNVSRIPEQDAVGVTVVLLTCSYRNQEFVRVGYFINNEYADPELRENPPPKPLFHKMTRNILATKPRVTRFKINWDDTPANGVAGPSSGLDGEVAPDDMGTNGIHHHHGEGNEGDDDEDDEQMDAGSDSNSQQQHSLHHHPPAEHDDNSIALPPTEMPEFNENSNSLAMEC